jgi:hypothetical protein
MASIGSITTRIIKDGLVFNVDAANRASYAKTGTTITDTINNFSGTFSSTPIFDPSEGQGVIDFDSTDVINFGTNVFTNYLSGATQFTCMFWCKKDASNKQSMVGSWQHTTRDGFFIQWYTDGTLYFGVSNGGSNNTTVGVTWEDRWFCLVGVFDGSLTNNNRSKIYVDGNLTSYTSPTNLTSFTTDASELQIGSLQNYANYTDGKIGPVHIYNRALSANEVLHNYNALKGRFE